MAEESVKVLVEAVLGTAIRAAKEEISYIRNSDESVEKLREQADSLRFINRKLELQLDNAKKEGQDVVDGLQEEVKKANGEISIVDKFLVEQSKTKKNWRNRYRYGKTAVSKLPSLERLEKRLGEMSPGVSVSTSVPRTLDLIERKNFSGIRTQKKSLEDIIEAVKDEKIQIIGIYGPGGVGKTTLAHEVAVRVKDRFDDIVLVTVSENVDVERIKDSVKTAARRIQKKDKILIILDDVWKELDISRLGIPCGADHMNCKIMLTSRSKKVCEAMKAGKKILIESLPKEDALSLFKNVVDKKLDDEKSKQIAEEVLEICGGLPLIIEVVGKVFHKQRTNLWEETLSQLKNHSPSVIQQEIRERFTLLRLSYDHLESEEAKFCFLLSSMFPEDEFIPLERLAYYGVSLGKFNRLRSIKEARDRVQIAVDTLKSSSLLLNGKDKFTTKMHDVVREVAHLIASKGQNNFLVEAGVGLAEWIPRKNGQSDYTGISLMRNDIREVPNYVLHFPDLNTFLIQENHNLSEISEEFIEGIKEAKVLDMEHNNISTLPNSMKLLVKLRLLNLGGNSSLKDISILGELEQLEILILNDTSIKEIPQEIGKLENLRRLEVKRCYNLCHIAPGVISKLRWLEELCIGYYPVRKEGCSTFEDLKKLSKLVYLYLFVTDYDLIPSGVHLERVEEFVIIIGKNEIDFDLPREHSKHLLVLGKFFLDVPDLVQKELIPVSDAILLLGMTNLSSILFNFLKGSKELNTIALYHCCTGSYLNWEKEEKFPSRLEHLKLSSLTMLEVLWRRPNEYISLSKLATLTIDNCPRLVKLFPVSVAKELVELQMLSITSCPSLVEVICIEDDDTANIKIDFDKLTHIFFSDLKKLESFCPKGSQITCSSLESFHIIRCGSMKKWVDGEYTLGEGDNINDAVLKLHQKIRKEKKSVDIDESCTT